MKKRIFVAGSRGMVGSAIVRQLTTRNDVIIITKDRSELNLLSQSEVQDFFSVKKLMKSILQLLKLAEYSPTTITQQNLFMRTW